MANGGKMNTDTTGGIPSCEWLHAKKPAIFRNCWTWKRFSNQARRLEAANEHRVKSKGWSNACWAAYTLPDSKSERYG